MKFNLAVKEQKSEAFRYFMRLSNKHCSVEIKKINPKRTLPQNSYLHLLLGAFGLHFGYTLEESKLIYKEVNKELYYYKKKGRIFIKSSADLDKEEMAQSIDRFMQKSAEAGYELPPAENAEWLSLIANEMEQGARYL